MYQPKPPPFNSDVATLAQYLFDQLQSIAQAQSAISNFGPAPKTHWLDRGDAIEAVDEYTMERRGQPFKKGMTTASDRIAAGRRLALDETSPQYMQTDGGLIALPRRPGAGQIAARPVTGEDGQSFSQQV